MGNTRKNFISRQDLLDNKVKIEVVNNNIVIYQDYIQTSKKDYSYLWSTERTQHKLVNNHLYGGDYVHLVTSIKIGDKLITMPVSNIVWIYYNDTIPAGYEVDHIDENTLDNRIDNLQLLTPKENLRKRKFNGANQYLNSTHCNSLEEYLIEKENRKMQREMTKLEKAQARVDKMAKREEVDAKIVVVKSNIEKYQRLLDEAKEEWHDLVKERNAIA